MKFLFLMVSYWKFHTEYHDTTHFEYLRNSNLPMKNPDYRENNKIGRSFFTLLKSSLQYTIPDVFTNKPLI